MSITNFDILTSHGNAAGRKEALQIIESGFEVCDPYPNMQRLVRIDGKYLVVGHKAFEPHDDPSSGDVVIDLSSLDHIYVLGAGKGVQRVAQALEDILGDYLTGGHIVDKKGPPITLKKIGVTMGAHPVPDQDCVLGARRILAITDALTERDLVFTIGASGFSSLLTLPAPGVTLADIQRTVYLMQIDRGAPTGDLSPIRNHLDMLKGGRIADHIHPARAIHIIAKPPIDYHQLIYDNRWVHTLPDSTSFDDAVQLLKKWNAWDDAPSSVREHLLRADPQYETVKPERYNKLRFRIFSVLPGEQGLWITPRKTAEALGYRAVLLAKNLRMEAAEAGRFVGIVARTIEEHGSPFQPPVALFTAGELLVTVGKEDGVGGRNQEYVLSAGLQIAGSKRIVVAAVDTDGTDGPGPQYRADRETLPTLAGGIVDGTTAQNALSKNLDIRKGLKQHDASSLLLAMNSGILATQYTGLQDLAVVLVTR